MCKKIDTRNKNISKYRFCIVPTADFFLSPLPSISALNKTGIYVKLNHCTCACLARSTNLAILVSSRCLDIALYIMNFR